MAQDYNSEMSAGGSNWLAQAVTNFGVFEFDAGMRELKKRGLKIKLEEQPLHVLAILLEKPGRVVSREELRRRLWAPGLHVEFDRSINKAIYVLRQALGDSPTNPHFIDTVPRRGYRFLAPVEVGRNSGAPSRVLSSVFVLPVENLSGDATLEYVADGITDALITSLGRIKALRVISRTSAMCYKGIRQPLPEIARQIGADFVLEGSLVCSNTRVRISLRFNEACNERQLWSETFDGETEYLIGLYTAVERVITDFINSQFSLTHSPLTPQTGIGHPEAYDAYLKARYLWNRRTERDLQRSIELHQRAIECDPKFALAYAGLADSLLLLGIWGLRLPHQVFPEARAAAERAIELDATLAEAHTSLAEVRKDYDWDWRSAERGYRRAIALNPSYSTAHHWYAQLLCILGRHQEAIEEIKKAQCLDPVSPSINAFVSYVHLSARQYDRAADEALKAIDLEPASALAHWYLGRACCGRKDWNEAVRALDEASKLSSGQPMFRAGLVFALWRSGDLDRAGSTMADLQEYGRRHYVSPFEFAIAYAGAGDRQAAVEWLERAFDQRVMRLVAIADPEFDLLRGEGAYQNLCTRLALPCPAIPEVQQVF